MFHNQRSRRGHDLDRIRKERDDVRNRRAVLAARLRGAPTNATSELSEAPAAPSLVSESLTHIPAPLQQESIRPTQPATRPIFHLKPALLDDVSVFADILETPPHLVRLLVSTVLSCQETRPVCIVLPAIEHLASLVGAIAAIECLAADLPERLSAYAGELSPGMRVRLYPNGEVFEVGDTPYDSGAVRLQLIDKRNRRTNGTRIVPRDRTTMFEPTTRFMPIGSAQTRFDPPHQNELDAIVGRQFFGNSGLVRTRILLLGQRAEFQRALHGIRLRPISGGMYAGSVASVFPFGGIGPDGDPRVDEPSGSAGKPMVAIARDLIEGARSCMNAELGTQVVLTDRINILLKDLDAAGRVAERQRLIAFADARKREEIEPLRRLGWVVWEPTPAEILGGMDNMALTDCRGLDRSRRGAAAETRRSPAFISCQGNELQVMEDALVRIGNHLADESVEHEPWVEDVLAAAQGAFFAASGWLAPPTGNAREAVERDLDVLASRSDHIRWYLGSEAGEAVADLSSAVGGYLHALSDRGITSKGAELLRLARTAASSQIRQVFVAGNRQSREEADAFLAANEIALRCLSVQELLEEKEPDSVVAFSVMRKDIFERLVDPWPSGNTLFLGYDYEITCYRRRLARREALRNAARITPEYRQLITGMPDDAFGNPPKMPSVDEQTQSDSARILSFDRATRDWGWSRRITVPQARPGEATCDTTIIRFVGRSWSPMTAEHRPIVIEQAVGITGKTAVREAAVADLAAGSRIVVREGGDRDIVRLIAEERIGSAKYALLRRKSGLWREALRSGPDDVKRVSAALKRHGIRRNPVTVRSWIINESMIGPKYEDDFRGIAAAFPLAGKSERDWQSCWDAICELRSLHIWAGSHLTELLAAQCGRMLFEPSDTELAVDLGIGIAWVLEIASIEEGKRACPVSCANRLLWLDQEWKQRLLGSPVREKRA